MIDNYGIILHCNNVNIVNAFCGPAEVENVLLQTLRVRQYYYYYYY